MVYNWYILDHLAASFCFLQVDAKCPHLGLPMKKGKIENGSPPLAACHVLQNESQHLCQHVNWVLSKSI